VNKIAIYPDSVLRQKCALIKKWSKEWQEVGGDLRKILSESKIGIGLAAPQIGARVRLFVIRSEISCECGHSHGGFSLFVNPEIRGTFGKSKVYSMMADREDHEEEFFEGCLSFPDIYGSVKRWLKIKASWQELDGEGRLVKKKAILKGLAAIVFQHELDHLDGILFIDHIRKQEGHVFRFDKKGEKKTIPWLQLKQR